MKKHHRLKVNALAISRGKQLQGVSLSSFFKAELSRPAVVSPRVTITHLIIYCPYCLWHQLLSDFLLHSPDTRDNCVLLHPSPRLFEQDKNLIK